MAVKATNGKINITLPPQTAKTATQIIDNPIKEYEKVMENAVKALLTHCLFIVGKVQS